jgi:hypothetical protein
MKHIDLLDFAVHSQKINQTLLIPAPTQKKPLGHKLKVFLALAMDLFIVMLITAIFNKLLLQTANSFFIGDSLELALEKTSGLELWIYPMIALSYFFSCFCLNEGQSLGMRLVQKRLDLHSPNLKECLKWSLWSMSACFTFGISSFLIKAPSFVPHDHLYLNLLTEKDQIAINLIEETRKYQEAAAISIEDEDFKMAA